MDDHPWPPAGTGLSLNPCIREEADSGDSILNSFWIKCLGKYEIGTLSPKLSNLTQPIANARCLHRREGSR